MSQNKQLIVKNKQLYNTFCEENDIPIFHKNWWLNAVCGEDGWDVILYQPHDKVLAAMPYKISSSVFFTKIEQPIFTQKLGPFILKQNYLSAGKQISLEKKIFAYFIDNLPKFHFFTQNFTTDVNNWLPFFWSGFKQTTRYSYVINNLTDFDLIYSNFDRSKKKHIKKCLETISVKFDVDARAFYDHHKLTMNQNGKKINYSFTTFKCIYDSAILNDSGRIIGAYDQDNNLHAALFVVWDNQCAYNLISTIDVNFRNSGASSLVVYEAIKNVAENTKSFDFCGSMDEHIESSIRKFGGDQVTYFSISKINSSLLRCVDFLKSELRNIKKFIRS